MAFQTPCGKDKESPILVIILTTAENGVERNEREQRACVWMAGCPQGQYFVNSRQIHATYPHSTYTLPLTLQLCC